MVYIFGGGVRFLGVFGWETQVLSSKLVRDPQSYFNHVLVNSCLLLYN